MKKLILMLIISLTMTFEVETQSIVGSWEGDLEVQGTTLKLILHIENEEGVYSSKLDSPNQGAYGIEMDETSYEGVVLTIAKKQMNMSSTFSYDADIDMFKGRFKQGPMDVPLELARVSEGEAMEATNNHPIAGDWNAELNTMGMQLRLVFHVTELNGVLSTTLDSPDQGAFGMKVDTTIADENNIEWISSAIGMKTTGEYLPDSNMIKATFSQGGQSFPLRMIREEIAKKEIKRPQEPTSFDYIQEEVQFVNKNGGHSLAGTLTIPKGGAFEKVAILVSGSGPQDRNEELIGHKPFLVLSDYLTRNGVAVLRYDDRGVAESTGDFETATSMDLTEDAVSAVEFLRARSDMAGKKIGIMGHSEGGLIAPIAADLVNLDFVVLLAGPGIDADELLLEQTEAILKANGEEQSEIKFGLESSRQIFEYMNENVDMEIEDLRKNLSDILRKRISMLPKEDIEEMGDVEEVIKTQIESVTSPWFRYFINYSPSDYLSKLKLPTLAVNGSLDLQVLPKSNLAGIKEQLVIAGNKNYVIKEFEGLNHLFQMSETGAPSEYGSIEETFNEEALAYILDWVINYDKK